MTEAKETVEVRAAKFTIEERANGAGPTAIGYASLFESDVDIGGMWIERFTRGAFAKTLKNDDIRAYFNHDRGRVLGRVSAGTLRLEEDRKGLRVEIDLPNTSDGNDIRTLLERGDITGMSIGFIPVKQEWDESVEPALRTISAAELHEVSIVSEPANEDTEVGLRSRDAARKQHNYSAASRRLAMKVDLDLRSRGRE